MAQIQELQNEVISLSDAREFYVPESGSSSGATHVPSKAPTILSLRTLCLAAILDCRVKNGILRVPQETFLNDHLLKKGDPRIWHRLRDLILQKLQGEERVKLKENR